MTKSCKSRKSRKFKESIKFIPLATASSLVAAGLAVACMASAAYCADQIPEMAVLQESKPLVTRAGAWHTWNDHIHLKPGQEKLPLKLDFVNGADGRPKATDMKVLLDRKPLADFKNFSGGNSFSIDLTGKLHPGNTALSVQGFGPSGAWLKWNLSIQRPVITAVTPTLLSAGDTVTISGANFSAHADRLTICVADKHAKVTSSNDGEIKFKMPSHTSAGNRPLIVSHQSVKSAPFMVSVKATAPHIAHVDMQSSPPQHPVVLTGSGFSPVKSDNVVTFGGHKAEVTAATATSITCIIPDMHFPQWNVPIKVITNGVASKEHVTINVDVRVIEKGAVLGP